MEEASRQSERSGCLERKGSDEKSSCVAAVDLDGNPGPEETVGHNCFDGPGLPDSGWRIGKPDRSLDRWDGPDAESMLVER